MRADGGASVGKSGIAGRLDVTSALSFAGRHPSIGFSGTHVTATPDNALAVEFIRYHVTTTWR